MRIVSKIQLRVLSLLWIVVPAGGALAEPPVLTLADGDHICLIGNALGERMQHNNVWETELYSRFPDKHLVVRNLCFSADEPRFRSRSENFGSPDVHLAHSKASVILGFFGFNESFRGEKGVPQFKADLAETVRHMLDQNYNGQAAPRIVLVSPIAAESLASLPLFDAKKAQKNLERYTDAIREVAQETNVGFVDLFRPTTILLAQPDQLTINGVHLNDSGYRALAPILNDRLFGPPDAPVEFNSALHAEIADKSFHWFNRYRAVDGFYIYGGRSRLEFEPDKSLTNAVVLERERKILDQMVANRDERIWKVAQGQPISPIVDDSNTDPFIEVGSNYGGPQEGKEGSLKYLSPEAAKQQFEVAEGFEWNCFASEQDFPELAKPVQFTFDAKGRLWVAVMPSYPQWQPKSPMNDKLLILEDTNQDGKADKCTVFADGLHVPTGFELGHGGVFVAQQPDLMFLRDTNGDDVADERHRILHGFDSGDTHHAISAFTWGPDGGLYMLEGTFHHTSVETPYGPVRNAHGGVYRFDPRTWKFETHIHYNFANPWGITFDRWGQHFVADASGGANYYATPFSGNAPQFTGQDDFGPFKYKYRREMKQFIVKRFRPTAGCEFVSSRHFPDDTQGHFLLNNCIGEQGIYEHLVEDEGSGFAATEIRPLVRSRDRNFRPVALRFAPDGSLYVCDWHNALVGHMQHHIRDPNRDHTHGRIWRLTAKGRPLLAPPQIDGQPVTRLLELLKEYEDQTRYRARRELCQRETEEVMPALKTWLAGLDSQDSNHEHHLLEALWVCQQHNVVDSELLARVLHSPEPRARAAATRVVCYWRDQLPDALSLLRQRADDEHPRVRLEVVRACSFFTDKPEEAAEIALTVVPNGDYYLEYTLKETMDMLERYLN
jgi:putative membrane-bound dehydrogenase-like protein